MQSTTMVVGWGDMDKSKLIERAKKRFKEASEYWSDNLEQAEHDIKFARLGEQWPEKVRRDRELEGRPCLTINKMPAFIRQIVNDGRMNKPSINFNPVDDNSDPKVAEILDGVTKNIEVSSNADIAYDTALETSASCGLGYIRANVDYATEDAFDYDILIDRVVNPLSVLSDHKATEGDGCDWRFCFVTEWISKDEFERRWPDVDVTHWEGGDQDQEWVKEDEVRIAEYWEREEVDAIIYKLSDGQVVSAERYLENAETYQAAGIQIVKERPTKVHQVTQYWLGGDVDEPLDVNEWQGKYIPIIPVYGEEVWVNNKVHYNSAIRHAVDSQRMFNYWRTTSTELVALAPKAPFIGPVGAFETDSRKWGTANTKSHPFIEYDGDISPQRQPFAGVPAGALQEAMNSSDDMKSIIGIHDAGLGARSNETSGKAILARQREGDISTFHFVDNLNRAIRQLGRVIGDLIPKVYSEPRILRIIGEDDKTQNVQVNQPFDDNGLERFYDLTAGRYDVTVSTGASFTTQREEAVSAMTELIRAQPSIAPIIGDVVVKMMDFKDADKISERLQAMLPPQIKALEQQEINEDNAKVMIGQLTSQLEQMKQQIQEGMAEFNKIKEENQGLVSDAEQKDIEIKALREVSKIESKIHELELKEKELVKKESLLSGAKETTVSINAPSGNTYNAVLKQTNGSEAIDLSNDLMAQFTIGDSEYAANMNDNEILIKTPSGRVYSSTEMTNGE